MPDKQIPLGGKGKGLYTIIDEGDLNRVALYNWHISSCGYVQTNINQRTVKLHRYILDITKRNQIVDHINHDKLDNRRKNLRICSDAENARNRLKHKNGKSIYKGIKWCNRDKAWIPAVGYNYKRVIGGYFKDEILAAKRYDQLARLYHKEFANLNFPEISDYTDVEQYLSSKKSQ